MEKLLTEINLEAIEELASKMGGTGISTVKELVANIRTLQQQNKKETERAEFWQQEQLKILQSSLKLQKMLAIFEEQNAQMKEALETIASIKYDNLYYSHEDADNMKEIAQEALQSIQGGPQ